MPKVRVTKKALWKAIKEHCLECSGFSRKGRRECSVEGCKLFEFRLGPETPASEETPPYMHEKPEQNPSFE